MRGYLIVHLLLNRHIWMIKNHSHAAKITLLIINDSIKCSVFRVGFNPKAFAFKSPTAYFAIHLSHLRMVFTTKECFRCSATIFRGYNANPIGDSQMIKMTLCTVIIVIAILKSALRHSNPYP